MNVTKSCMLIFMFTGGLVGYRNPLGFRPAEPDGAGRESAGTKDIAAVRYAPPGMYMKDHCLIYEAGEWHLFAPLGPVGTMWSYPGSEESAEHMISKDLVHWQHIGTAVGASRRAGYFDGIMAGIAPHVIRNGKMYFMFYAGWNFKSKDPRNMQGFRQGIGLAISKDLVHWHKPDAFVRNGLTPKGSDQCVVRDERHGRWLLYVGRSGAVAVYQSKDLLRWSAAGLALNAADLRTGNTGMNPGESPFVMKHPVSRKWIMLVNGGYSVSANPFKFPPVTPYPFKAGVFTFPNPHDEGKGTFYHADDDGAGFAHEVIEFNGQWYLTGAVGLDGHTRLKFTPIEWTTEALRLAR